MKQSSLLLLVTLLVLSSCQDQWKSQYFDWPYPIVEQTLSYCAQAYPAPNNTYCKTCLPGLTKSLWFYPCQLPKIPDYCISFDWHYNCYFCTAGFYVNYGVGLYGTNNCTSKRVGCEVYDQSNKYCLTCKSSYAMNTTLNIFNKSENYCVFNPDPNCVSYAPDMNTCQSCKNGYSLFNNKCITIANCEIYNGNLCSKCVTGYLTASSGAECIEIPKILNCAIQQLTVCKKCITNYEVNINGNCVAIPKIAQCESQTDYNCNKCVFGFILQNNQCKYIIPNCIEIIDKKCIKCSNLYYVNQMSTCTLAPKIPQCVQQNGLTCVKCSTNYIFNSETSICEYHIQNCLSMLNLTCQSCFQGFVLSDNQCIARTIIYDVNCRRYDQVSIIGKCLQCSQGYILNDAKCLQVDPLCKTYDLKTGYCLTCYIGYKLNQLNGKCVIAPADQSALVNCNQFDYVKNVCVRCAIGSTFDLTGKCQKSNDVHCMKPSADLLSCVQCYNGYYYDTINKKCTISKFNCLTFNSLGKCATCPSGYSLETTSSVCNYVDQFCKTIHPLTKKCSSCYQGYGLNNENICQDVNILPAETRKYFINCSKFDLNGSCSQCYFRWVLARDSKGTFCQQVSDSCRTYQPKTGNCITCYLGYYLLNGNCVRYM